jgi:hypothetical protein
VSQFNSTLRRRMLTTGGGTRSICACVTRFSSLGRRGSKQSLRNDMRRYGGLARAARDRAVVLLAAQQRRGVNAGGSGGGGSGSGGGGVGGDGSPSTLSGVMDRMAQTRSTQRSDHYEQVQAERRAALNRLNEERRKTYSSPGTRGRPQPATAPAAGASTTKPEEAAAGKDDAANPTATKATGAFAKKLNSMHRDMYETRKESNFTVKDELKHKQRVEDRRKMLRFREVDEQLDQLILRRDMFLWLSTIRKGGMENMVDQTLERELRFYPEESNREVKYNPKLFTGLPYLIAGHPFPTLQKLTRFSSTPQMAARVKAEDEEAHSQSEQAASEATQRPTATRATVTRRTLVGDTASTRIRSLFTGSGDDKGGVMINRTSFAKPTLVTMSQLTFHYPVQQFDEKWIELLRPETSPFFNTNDTTASGTPSEGDGAAAPEAKPGPAAPSTTMQGKSSSTASAIFHKENFNVLRLKSVETSAVRWMKPIVVNNFVKQLTTQGAQETLMGDKLVRSFMPTFNLRNFSTTYCLLVDTKGRVRWMSAGEPTLQEKAIFPTLLRELEMEYLTSVARR